MHPSSEFTVDDFLRDLGEVDPDQLVWSATVSDQVAHFLDLTISKADGFEQSGTLWLCILESFKGSLGSRVTVSDVRSAFASVISPGQSILHRELTEEEELGAALLGGNVLDDDGWVDGAQVGNFFL